MKILVAFAVIIMLSIGVANAQLTFQIKLQKDGLVWTDLDSALLTYEEVNGVRVVYDTLPDPDSTGTKDLQEWFVSAESGYNLVSFLASAAGIPLPQGNKDSQYWFRYGDGVVFSPSADFTISQPKRPLPK